MARICKVFALAEIAREQSCGAVLVTGDHRHLERLKASGGNISSAAQAATQLR
jgi:post-segregation antitoxin (ccd killing protein)